MAKKNVESHTSKTEKPMGDYYGTGYKQKVGRIREMSTVNPLTRNQLNKPPKKLA